MCVRCTHVDDDDDDDNDRFGPVTVGSAKRNPRMTVVLVRPRRIGNRTGVCQLRAPSAIIIIAKTIMTYERRMTTLDVGRGENDKTIRPCS